MPGRVDRCDSRNAGLDRVESQGGIGGADAPPQDPHPAIQTGGSDVQRTVNRILDNRGARRNGDRQLAVVDEAQVRGPHVSPKGTATGEGDDLEVVRAGIDLWP